VYPTGTKDSSVIGLEGLAAVCAAVAIPVVAIGGGAAGSSAATIEAGCAGVAVVSAVFASADTVAASRQLREEVDGAVARLQAAARS
jgi:thiamine monophosphate synthase